MTVTTDIRPEAVADALDIAADEIECEGWTTGAYRAYEGICVTEALSRATGLRNRFTEYRNQLFTAALGALHQIIDDPTDEQRPDLPVTAWNDRQTDPHVVLDALRRAARSTRP